MLSALGRRAGVPALTMVWHDLLFLHHRMPAAVLRPMIPAALELDTWDGVAWLGIVPFGMSHVRPLGLPLPGGRIAYDEINVRTYVTHGEHRGVWFFSLHAADRAASVSARMLFHLPYHHGRVRRRHRGDWIEYASRRDGARSALFRGRYRPLGPVRHAAPGSLEGFLTDRLCLFAQRRDGRLLRADIEHGPWPLQDAACEVDLDTMAASHGIAAPGDPPHLLFARRLEVVGRWPVPA
jgi:uncharacterized protein